MGLCRRFYDRGGRDFQFSPPWRNVCRAENLTNFCPFFPPELRITAFFDEVLPVTLAYAANRLPVKLTYGAHRYKSIPWSLRISAIPVHPSSLLITICPVAVVRIWWKINKGFHLPSQFWWRVRPSACPLSLQRPRVLENLPIIQDTFLGVLPLPPSGPLIDWVTDDPEQRHLRLLPCLPLLLFIDRIAGLSCLEKMDAKDLWWYDWSE